jgi:HAD superfamily hydrolase (TIGR01484 family)
MLKTDEQEINSVCTPEVHRRTAIASSLVMRYLLLATDYDGTLAAQGKVDSRTIEAVDRLLKSGRKFIVVTGRELSDLKTVFPEIDRCALVVAENGAVVYNPASQEELSLTEAPNPQFLGELTRHGVPFSVGHGIVATWEPHQNTVLDIIQSLGLELQLSFNKGAVMVLPSGINKQTGLHAALKQLRLSPHNVVGLGDAENDHVFLSACECAVAVANALPSLKERADITTHGGHGDGAAEIIEQLLANDLERFDGDLKRNRIILGTVGDNTPVEVVTSRGSILFAGPSGSGKSTAVTGLLEELSRLHYQFCLIDPEGDYEMLPGVVQFGSPQHAAEASQILKALEDPEQDVVVNLLGVALEDRPAFFSSLFLQLLELRGRSGRPHWIIVDEAHHMLPPSWPPGTSTMPQTMGGLIFITVHPDSIAPAALQNLEVAIAIGSQADQTLASAAKALGEPAPGAPTKDLQTGEGLVWFRNQQQDPYVVKLRQPGPERRRHVRKYAEGKLGPDRSFYFRGPENKLKLCAQNLGMFTNIAEGVDDDTWLFHLKNGDYSRWFQEAIKDGDLAEEVKAVERDNNQDAAASRTAVRAAIEKRYTLAA